MSGDFDNYAEQGLQFGRTVAYEVTELVNADGTHPIVHLEHLGIVNASVVEEIIARASANEKADEGPKGPLETHARDREAMIKHSVRRLENTFKKDGTAATDADIPAFVNALPYKVLHRMMLHAVGEANFCKIPIAEKPAVLAEK